MIRVLLAEDQALVRDGLCALLELEGGFAVRAVNNGKQALAAAAEEAPDIAVLDVRMPEMDGVVCTRELRKRYPRLPILILTTFDERALVQRCLEAGASAYLLKDIEPGQLATAIRLLVAGERLIPGDLARAILKEQGERREQEAETTVSEALTPRQEEVLQLIAAGLSNGEIAEKLYLSEGTVKNTVSEIYARLGVRDRVQAVLKMLGRAGVGGERAKDL